MLTEIRRFRPFSPRRRRIERVAIVGGGICGLVARAQSARSAASPAASTSARPRSRSSASASRCCRMRCANSPRSASATSCSRAGIENRESCFFNRFGQLIYKEPRGKFAGYPVSRSRHPSRPAASASSTTRCASGSARTRRHQSSNASASSRTSAAHRCISSETTTGARAAAGARRRRDRLRRHQFGDAQAVLSGRQASRSPASTPGAA